MNLTRQSEDHSDTIYGVEWTTSNNKYYVDRLNLFPHSGPVPHVELGSINSGGALTTGVYSIALAYVDKDLVATNYLTVDNPVPIVEDHEYVVPQQKYDGAEPGSPTGKSITWSISNVNTDYDYLRAAIIQTIGDATFTYKLNDVGISTNSTTITFTGAEGYTQLSRDEVIIDTVQYDKIKTLEQLDGVLYAGNLEGSLDVGFQKHTANIVLKAKQKEVSDFDPYNISFGILNGVANAQVLGDVNDKDKNYRSPYNSYKYRGYMRDEIYAFYIAFVLNDGRMSYAYHIPGRKAITVPTDINNIGGTVIGTTYTTETDEVEASAVTLISEGAGFSENVNSITGDPKYFQFKDFAGSVADGSNYMNYWENKNEYYPETSDYNDTIFKNDDGTMSKVRHHHFPSNATPDFHYYKGPNNQVSTSAIDSDDWIPMQWTSQSGGDWVEYTCNGINDLEVFTTSCDSTGTGGAAGNTADNWTAIKIVQDTAGLQIGETYNIDFHTTDGFSVLGVNITPGQNFEWNGELLEVNGNWTLWEGGGAAGGASGTPGMTASAGAYNGCVITQLTAQSNQLDNDVLTGKISSHVRILGFELEDIKIPESIADKVQGFKIYYAKRDHETKSILGQGLASPYTLVKDTSIGGCTSEDLNNNNTEDLLVKIPFYTSSVINSDEQIENLNRFRTAFYSFDLLRTKNSIANATHVTIEGAHRFHTWAGAGQFHEEGESEATCESQNLITSTFGMMAEIDTGDALDTLLWHSPKAIDQRCKTYIKGDSIYDGRSLGFGSKIYNVGGESHIGLQFKKMATSSGLTTPFFNGNMSDDDQDVLINVQTSDPFKYISTAQVQLPVFNLRSFKTDMYNTIDSQTLVWTGFEVLGEDLNNFIVGGTYETTAPDFKTTTVQENSGSIIYENDAKNRAIFGGDTFICNYGIRQSLYPKVADLAKGDLVSGFYTLIESSDNINYRHELGKETAYFPAASPLKFLYSDRAGEGHDTSKFYDYTHQDNIKYNENYSLVNDIRPAFPLPLLISQPTSFPTRIQRSAKSDPGSLIDNFRVFLALQYKDLPKNRGSIWNLVSFNNLLYMHMEDSLFASKGKQTMEMKDGSEAFIGSGDILLGQDPDELVQTEAGYGGTNSQYASTVTRFGYFSLDQRNRKVFLSSDKMYDIGNLGMEKWFNKNIPFYLEEYGYSPNIDSPIHSLGFISVWDSVNSRILLTKRDLKPTSEFIRRFNAGLPADNPDYLPYIPDDSIVSSDITEIITTVITLDDIDFTVLSESISTEAPINYQVEIVLEVNGSTSGNDAIEGDSIGFGFYTDLPVGTEITYTIAGTGVTTADISLSSLTGTVTVQEAGYYGYTDPSNFIGLDDESSQLAGTGNYTFLEFGLEEDGSSEVAETLTLTITYPATSAQTVTTTATTNLIFDEVPITYSLSMTTDISGGNPVTSVDEGDGHIIHINSTGVADGIILDWTLASSTATDADLAGTPIASGGTVTVNNNMADVDLGTVVADFLTEQDDIMTFTLTSDGGGTTHGTFVYTINDTSTTVIILEGEPPALGATWEEADNPYSDYDGVVVQRDFFNGVDATDGYEGFIVLMADAVEGRQSWYSWEALFTNDSTIDWPSKHELVLMYEQKALVDDNADATDYFSSGSYSNYWSSTEHTSPDRAWLVNFDSGYASNGYTKDYTGRVRAIKRYNTTGLRKVSRIPDVNTGIQYSFANPDNAFVNLSAVTAHSFTFMFYEDAEPWIEMFIPDSYLLSEEGTSQAVITSPNLVTGTSGSAQFGNHWLTDYADPHTIDTTVDNYNVLRLIIEGIANTEYTFTLEGFEIKHITQSINVNNTYSPGSISFNSLTNNFELLTQTLSNLVQNGNFEISTNLSPWAEVSTDAADTVTVDSTNGSNRAHLKNTTGAALSLKQLDVFTIGHKYNIYLDVEKVSGTIRIKDANNAAVLLIAESGHHELLDWEADRTDIVIADDGGLSEYYIDNVVVNYNGSAPGTSRAIAAQIPDIITTDITEILLIEEDTELADIRLFERTGWTISYCPEFKFWGSFHDYIPSFYTYSSDNIYSFNNNIIDNSSKVYGDSIWLQDTLELTPDSVNDSSISTTEGIVHYTYDTNTNAYFIGNFVTYGLSDTVEYLIKGSVSISLTGISAGIESGSTIADLARIQGASDTALFVFDSTYSNTTQEFEFTIEGVSGELQIKNSVINSDLYETFTIEIIDFQILPISHYEQSEEFSNIWQHDDFNEPGNFYGTTYPFEVEFIDNTERQVPKLFSSFGYETEVTNRQYVVDGANSHFTGKQARTFQDGFTNFFVYNDTQCSGLNNILYFRHQEIPGNLQGSSNIKNKGVRKVGNEWRINDFRDMAYIKNSSIPFPFPTLGNYSGDNDTKILSPGMWNLGGHVSPFGVPLDPTDTQVDYNNILATQGMYEVVNPFYVDSNKPWHQQKKFMDTYIGIRLINDNSRKILVNLYSTSVAMRKYNR